ncbi:MAG TPA: DegT/DnrJ/EryC1/StrS family aminotransferase [Candidatus Acidoferrum sp.]|jgi:dTDP-4-amino-4,6-dideoxygalactose transaminase|nr:DegT/DnrJ/EryC1/StrS family aminotransferase [Candidatus Acidoferrum sp.]
MSGQVPFLDLRIQHEPLMAELVEAFREVTEASAFSGGPYVSQFETEFAAFCEAQYALGVGSGTDALWLSLLALGVGPGDEVITVPNSFMATAEAISLCGARPVFVDVDERTYTMDPGKLEAAITMRTQAILPVHLFGQMADMDGILAIARRGGTPVIEDACQAHGAEYKGRKAGSLGVAGCFSFYPGKNLGAFGEAGAVVTDELEVRSRIQMLRDHGQAAKYIHAAIGWNARMDGIQAAVLSLKLRRLDAANAARREHAKLYNQLLEDEPRVIRPAAAPHCRHVYHVYAVRVPDRDAVLQRMAAQGVNCGIHYPVPIHLQRAYEFLGLRPGSFPVAERCAQELLSLPMYPELTEAQIERVVETLKQCLPAASGRDVETVPSRSGAGL